MNDKKYLPYIGAAVLCLILLFALDKYRGGQQLPNERADESAQSGAASSTQDKTAEKPAVRKKLPYGEAVNTYAYRIQFSNCSGNPGSISIKKGVALMLDNRDNKAHTFKIGNWTMKVANYDYALFVPTSANLGFSKILCDGGGAADLNVEL